MAETDRLVVLDRDGVINHDSAAYIKSPDEWLPIDGSLEAIAALNSAGFRVAVVSNQSGIGRGLLSEASLEAIHSKMIAAAATAGGEIAAIYYCPHTPEDNCDCRKPRPGLMLQVAADCDTSLVGVPFVGDKPADVELARAVGARPLLVLTGYGQDTAASLADDAPETYPDLAAVARALIEEPSR
jgi:D-glycero-D-manno-heptose 1,7-bisphosphate phosphatase